MQSNSIASPQLVDYRLQTAQLGITNTSGFLAALGPDPCHIFAEGDEYNTCVYLLGNSDFVSQLTGINTGLLGSFQQCASDYAMGAPDYQVIVNDPNNPNANSTCPEGIRFPHPSKRTSDSGDNYDITPIILESMNQYRSNLDPPVRGPMKSSKRQLTLVKKQASTCANTGQCFDRCPDCRDAQTYCGTQAVIITTAVCASVAALANAAAATAAGATCTAACAGIGPLAVFCGGFCARAAGGLAAVAVGAACAETRSSICDPLTQRCDNCNSANNGICNKGSTQCCPGETGTQCGQGCCCCPRCYAPGGLNCACTAAPC